MPWYGYMILGFTAGAYLHSKTIRHWINWLIIKCLRWAIWLVARIDYQKQPEVKSKPASHDNYRPPKDGINIDEQELNKWLKNNPDLKITERANK